MRKHKILPAYVLTVIAFIFSFLMLTGCGAIDEYVPELSEIIIEEYENAYTDSAGDSEAVSDSEEASGSEDEERVEFTFRNKKLLNQHYEKHGIDMGFSSAEEYEKAACNVIYNPDVLKKTEKEDGDYVFYVEETNEFVVVSTDGYIRTYFLPDSGKAYFDRQ